MSCRILIPQPGINPMPPSMVTWSLNHKTARKIPYQFFGGLSRDLEYNNAFHEDTQEQMNLRQAIPVVRSSMSLMTLMSGSSMVPNIKLFF